jgi:GNAT superfamily N-acetyltransferase
VIAVALPEDAAAAVELLHLCGEPRVVTPAGLRYRMESALPEDRRRNWKAVENGDLVGWGHAALDAFASERGTGHAHVLVHPGRRGAGIGRALWAHVSEHLRCAGAARVLVYAEDDPRTTAFAQRCGLTLGATHVTSAVDPRVLDAPPAPPPGVGILPMSTFEKDPPAVYAADREASQDEPGPADLSGMTYKTWRRLIWDAPECDRELSVVAVEHDRVIGTSFLSADRARGRAANSGTGVVQAHRGRGVGLLMKQHSLARAADAGITTILAQNDEQNPAMLAINRRLGYAAIGVGYTWVGKA